MPLVSLRAYARHRGVTLGAVQTAIKAQRITTIDGKIDPEKADAEWTANTHNRGVRRGPSEPQLTPSDSKQRKPVNNTEPEAAKPEAHRKRGRPRKIQQQPAAQHDDSDPDDEPTANDDEPLPPGKKPPRSPRSIQEERLWNEYYTRCKLALEVKQKEGELVPVAQVEKDWFNLCRTVRDNLLNLANRLSTEIASCSDAHTVHEKLTGEIETILRDLSK